MTAFGGSGGTPWWLTLLVALASLTSVVLTTVVVRRTGKESNSNARLLRLDQRLATLELEKWRRREETMRMLRWAAERAMDRVSDVVAVGVAALEALGSSELLQDEDQAFIDRMIDAILSRPIAGYADAQGDLAEVRYDEE